MRAARERAVGRYYLARAGVALGVANVVVWAMLLTVLGMREHRLAVRRDCAANLRLIGLAMLLYSNDNRGQYPPTLDLLLTVPLSDPSLDATFTCPACAGDPTKPPGDRRQIGHIELGFGAVLEAQDAASVLWISSHGARAGVRAPDEPQRPRRELSLC
jgi:hypothetical protein